MPFEDDAIRIDLVCGIRDDGHWHGTIGIYIRTSELRRLGLHPDQPTSAVAEPRPPRRWRAEAEARMYRTGRRRRRTD